MNFDIRPNGDRVEPLEISTINNSTNRTTTTINNKSPNDRIRLVSKYAISICGFTRLGIIVRCDFLYSNDLN